MRVEVANHKSAKKRAKQSIKKREQNKGYMSGVKTAIKVYQTAVGELAQGKGDETKAIGLFKTAQSLLNKAASKGLLHRNNVSRRVGRLYGQFVKASEK